MTKNRRLRSLIIHRQLVLCLALAASSTTGAGGPYPSFTGLVASADRSTTAGTNPAGITRFDQRQSFVELYLTDSQSTWEGRLGDEPRSIAKESSNRLVPSGSMVLPLGNDWYFGFTILGSGLSEDYGADWPGRYFIVDYELIYFNAFPSIARRFTDKLSVAVSLPINYTTYEQGKAVPNVDPGFGDGRLNVDADGFSAGVSASLLYEFSARTRVGLVYISEIDTELDGTASFSGLGPTAEGILGDAGLLDARIDVTSRQPQAVTAGLYHEFDNGGAVTFDFAWVDFSRFKLSEVFVNGDQIIESEINYEDIIALSAGYSFPLGSRWRLGVGALFVDDMVDDDERTLILRLDETWGAGLGLQWQWTPQRLVTANLTYLEVGDAPVSSRAIGGLGSVNGRFIERRTLLLQLGIGFGAGPR